MARSSYQKLKSLYVMDYLLRNSDEEHPVSVARLIDMLASHGISAERKSIYDDIEALRQFGVDILASGRGKASGYYVASRDFELAELKLLVDSVQASKFITQSKTLALIKKLEGLTDIHAAAQLNRQVVVQGRIKTMNESIYYNVDKIHRAIAADCPLRFHYFEYTVSRERKLRHGGAWYRISPYALCWDNENYYMIGFDAEAERIKHFRVDKMLDISLTEGPRSGKARCAELDMSEYARKTFGMFTGEEVSVLLRFDNSLAGAVIDRLGRDALLIPEDGEHFTVRTNAAVSPQFFSWICGFGAKAKILSPQSVAEELLAHVDAIRSLYC